MIDQRLALSVEDVFSYAAHYLKRIFARKWAISELWRQVDLSLLGFWLLGAGFDAGCGVGGKCHDRHLEQLGKLHDSRALGFALGRWLVGFLQADKPE